MLVTKLLRINKFISRNLSTVKGKFLRTIALFFRFWNTYFKKNIMSLNILKRRVIIWLIYSINCYLYYS